MEEWNLASLPIENNCLANIVYIRFITLEKLTCLYSNLSNKVLIVLPITNTKYIIDVFLFNLVEYCLNESVWIWDFLCTYNSLEYFICFCLVNVIHNTWTINKVNTFCKSDVLPHLCLTGNRSNLANLFLL